MSDTLREADRWQLISIIHAIHDELTDGENVDLDMFNFLLGTFDVDEII